ncbi:MAG: tetratricopeptide repeat protein [Capsulimonadaceae bacterium]
MILTPRSAPAHIEDYFDSVHFNCGHPDFGTPPRRAIISWNDGDDRPAGDAENEDAPAFERQGVELTRENDGLAYDTLNRSVYALSQRAAVAVGSNDWSGAAAAYRALVRLNGWTGGLRDRLTVIAAETAAGTCMDRLKSDSLRGYLHGMALDDLGKRAAARAALTALLGSHPDRLIRAHASYQLASLDYEQYRFRDAERGYGSLLSRDQGLRPAALLMLARCYLLHRRPTPADIVTGRTYVEDLVRSSPPVYYRLAIEGLQARIAYLIGHYSVAAADYERLDDLPSLERVIDHSRIDMPSAAAFLFAGYLRQLAAVSSFYAYEDAAHDVDRVCDVMTPDDATAFARLLHRNPSVAAPYFYYRLYLSDNTPQDLKSLARLADSLGREGGDALPAAVSVKLAEVYYQCNKLPRALVWANRSLTREATDRALFVRGACLLRMHRCPDASAAFTRMLLAFPQSHLARSAHEELALTREAMGDFSGALDQYVILGYRPDIAFLLDVRMTRLQVRQFLMSHLHTSLRNELMYSYGIRCLREEQWHEAAIWLGRVPRRTYRTYGACPDDSWYAWFDRPGPGGPLAAVRGLAVLQEAVDRAHTRRARAAALYAYASYYYTKGTLLLYNQRLWNGHRVAAFSWWWDTNVETPANNNAVRRYMYNHEVYARCLAICLRIARLYPDTPAAPKAMYRAACCFHNLSDFNNWWRDEDTHHGLNRQAIHWMQMVYTRYPHSPLAPSARKFAGVFADETAMYQPVRPISANNLSVWMGGRSGHG